MKTLSILIVALLTLSAARLSGTQATHAPSATFEWFGEFVSADSNSKTMTVKARLAYADAASAVGRLKAGEQVTIVWSGVNEYADAIRHIRKPTAAAIPDERLILPAELVSTETTHQYVTIRVTIPERSVAATNSLKPGDWVVVTTRQRPKQGADAIVDVRSYRTPTKAGAGS